MYDFVHELELQVEEMASKRGLEVLDLLLTKMINQSEMIEIPQSLAKKLAYYVSLKKLLTKHKRLDSGQDACYINNLNRLITQTRQARKKYYDAKHSL